MCCCCMKYCLESAFKRNTILNHPTATLSSRSKSNKLELLFLELKTSFERPATAKVTFLFTKHLLDVAAAESKSKSGTSTDPYKCNDLPRTQGRE